MNRPASILQPVFTVLTLASVAAAWWGCSTSPNQPTTGTSGATSSGTGGTGGAVGTAGTGGDVDIDSGKGGGNVDEGGACTSTSAEAHPVDLDMLFLIDQSGSMAGEKWIGTTKALTTFFNDPASAKIGAGMTFFPKHNGNICISSEFELLDVPIASLPQNAFALTNSIPAQPVYYGTPTYAALRGTLIAATAHQDAHPTHKVVVVLATDGDPNACGTVTIDDIAKVAKTARNYNGVLTYVVGVNGSIIANLDKIAAAGGTTAAYDITNDINEFSAKIADIRRVALGCDFEIPPPPNGEQLDQDKVNFSYKPKGSGTPSILPRADDLVDCGGKPGWYYDTSGAITKISLCPASCTTVKADVTAEVEVLFGCKSLVN